LLGHLDEVESVAFSPDEKILASGSWDKTIKLWNVETGEVIRTLQQESPVKTVAISPDGQFLASGNEDGKIMIWHLKTGKLKTPLAAHDKAVWSVAFSPDGKQIASGSYDRTIKLWNTQTAELLHTLSGHHNAVWSVAFSPDGKQIASGSYDRTIKLWNTQTGQLIRTFVGHNKAVWSVAFNPQGHTLASGSADETIKIWQVPSKAVMSTPLSASELAAVLTKQPESTDSTLFYPLTQKVYNQVNQAWQQRGRSEENFVYRVGVGFDGAIFGYQFINSDHGQFTQQTTKNDLLYKLVKRRPATREAIVHFKVVFTKQGILQVSPWRGYNTTN
jgi:WD40 repeat protein